MVDNHRMIGGNIMRDIVNKFKTLPKKSIGVAGVGIVGIVIMLAIFVFMNGNKTSMELKKENFIVEYGEQYSTKASDYIKADNDVLEDVVIKVENKHAKECPAGSQCAEFLITDVYRVGTYKATATYKKEKLEFTIEIKDTTKPVFKDFKEKVEVPREYTGDLSKEYTAEDLSEVTITVDTKEVDFNKAGEYKAKVTATDKNKNKTTKEFTVVVGEKSQAELDAEKVKAEEEARQEQLQQQQEQQEQQNQQNVNTGGNTGGGSTGGGSTGGGGHTCSFTGWQQVGNSGYANHNYDTAWDWGDSQALNKNSKWYMHGYYILTTKDTCGNEGWTIEFY